MTIWNGQLNATIKKYVKGKTDAYSRAMAAWGALEQNGRITTGHSGTNVVWNVAMKTNLAREYEDMQGREFRRHDLLKQATLPWAAYDSTFALSKQDLLMNRGQEQITNLLEANITSMTDGMRQRLAGAIYQDGVPTAAGLHGFMSWFGAGATLSNGFFNPSDTYAGLSTALGTYGGTAPTTTWPVGKTESCEYDFWSPLILSATSTAWGSAATWAANCLDILMSAHTMVQRNAENPGPKHVFMSPTWYRDLLRQITVKEQVIVGNTQMMAKLGYTSVNFYGMEIVLDYYCPDANAFGINCDVLELMSMQNEVFSTDAKVTSEIDKTDRYGMDFIGQLKQASPRNDFRVAELGA